MRSLSLSVLCLRLTALTGVMMDTGEEHAYVPIVPSVDAAGDFRAFTSLGNTSANPPTEATADSADPAAALIEQLLALIPTDIVNDAAQSTPPPSDTEMEDVENALVSDATVDQVPLPRLTSSEAATDETVEVLYFVGVISASVEHTTFCVTGPTMHVPSHRAGGIIDFLVAANGPEGRTLEGLSPRAAFRVAVSRVPEEVQNDFMSFHNAFLEVGQLDVVYAAPADSARVRPARDSELRSGLLASLGLADTVSVYVIYVYPEVFQLLLQNLWLLTAWAQNYSPLTSLAVAAPIIHPNLPVAPPPTPANGTSHALNGYLELNYAARKDQLTALLNMPGYQSAYKHCLIERHIMSVCNALGIIFSARQIVAAEVEFEGLTVYICPDDIALWMGILPGQFATCRTEVTAARAAHLLLRQLAQHELQGRTVNPPMEPRHHTLLGTLGSMMSTRILWPIDPTSGYMGVGDSQAGDANAVRMKIATLKQQVAEVKTLWAAQYQ
ncbi:hypothetical protein DFH07DRAFT_765129 [Mycena maculata]|uniref:Uncharacterized protein n=1 Tax=Mycena maculata TaxID=230809 RepID=A0AAD7K8J6_9AGAR|nr:hypothetical protein DFH07DRAFT_765129 [Mycena maculata]